MGSSAARSERMALPGTEEVMIMWRRQFHPYTNAGKEGSCSDGQMVAFTRQLAVILKHIVLWEIELEEYSFLFLCDLCPALLSGWQYSHFPVTRHSHSVALGSYLANQPLAADFPSNCVN